MLNLDETGQGQNPRSDMSQKENSGTWLKFGQRRESLSSPPRRLVPRSKCSATASCSRHAPPGLCAHCCCCWNAFPSTYQGPSGPHPPPLVSQAVPTGPVTGTFRTPPFLTAPVALGPIARAVCFTPRLPPVCTQRQGSPTGQGVASDLLTVGSPTLGTTAAGTQDGLLVS